MSDFDAERWGRLLEQVEGPTYHQVAVAIVDAIDVAETVAYDMIGDALDDGTLVERDGPGALPYLHATEPYVPDGEAGVPSEPTTEHYRGLQYSETESGAFGEAVDQPSWMPTCSGMDGKLPFAKYHDHPALDYYDPDDDEQSHPQYSWSDPSNWSAFEDADRQVRTDVELVGRAFIMQDPNDPYTWSNEPPADSFILGDGDKVIDQETGEPIPEYVAAIELLAGGDPTYQDVSGSKSGTHAMFHGELPGGDTQAFIQLREEPVDGYDEPPMLELYAGKHVVVFTGNKVAGTPDTYTDIDESGVSRLMTVATNAHPNVLTSAKARSNSATGGQTGSSGGGATGSVTAADIYPGRQVDDADGPDDAPGGLPKCYRRLLTARYAEKNLPTIGNHGVNLYLAQVGIAAGYTVEECLDHLAAFPPDGNEAGFKTAHSKGELVRTEKKHGKGLRPPGVDTLRRAGMLGVREECDDDCPIHGEQDGYIALLPDIDEPTARRSSFGSLNAQRTDDGIETDPADGRLNSDGAPTIADVRARTADEITSVMEQRIMAVVDGIMGGGKTYNSIGGVAGREEAGTYLSGRKDLYNQAAAYADEHGIPVEEIYVLPVPDDCPVWQGEYGDEWRATVRACYASAATMSAIHANHDDIPCCAGDRECPYEARNQYDPDDYLLLVGHHKHGHLPQVTAGRHTIIDEDPQSAYLTRLGGDALKRGVNAFLSLHDSPSLDSFDDVLRARHDPEDRRDALRWYDETNQGNGFDFKPDEVNACRFVDEGYHAYAPHAVYAMLTAEPVADTHGLYDEVDDKPERYEFEHATLPGIGNEAVFYTTSQRLSAGESDDYYVEFQTPPDKSLSYSRSVVALDGTPMIDTWSNDARRGAVVEWEYALGRPLEHRRVLTDDERAAFLRETMGHRYVQTTPHVRYYSSGKWRDPARDYGLLDTASEKYLDGEPWDVVISSKGAADTFRGLGFATDGDDDVRRVARAIDHRGNVRGSDRYAECRSGAIIGASHHGDHEIARRAAHLGAQIRPEGKGIERAYGPTGDAILEQMRELDTAQTALRIGRGGGGRGAIVLIDTCSVPEWIPIANDGKPADVSRWAKGERAVWKAVVSMNHSGTFRTDDLLDRVDVNMTPQHARRVLKKHEERGLVRKERDPDDGRRYVWVDTGLGDITDLSTVTVDLPELTERIEAEGDTNISHIGLLYAECSYFARHCTTPLDRTNEGANGSVVRTDGGDLKLERPNKTPPERRCDPSSGL